MPLQKGGQESFDAKKVNKGFVTGDVKVETKPCSKEELDRLVKAFKHAMKEWGLSQ
jgi:hypothetical protein